VDQDQGDAHSEKQEGGREPERQDQGQGCLEDRLDDGRDPDQRRAREGSLLLERLGSQLGSLDVGFG